ncbi:transketolase family protein [Candidatus Uhrbacteria bacterium]|nr:transketolase family protein [Candidatus Uhrbacteria bacterium]
MTGINPKMKLVSNWNDLSKLEQKPTRDGYGEGVVIAGEADKNIVVLCCDLTESTRSLAFKKKFPERFIQLGVSEQSMVVIAGGLALAGKVPWISSYTMFCPGRAWEQVRTNLALNEVNVKIAGAHSGVSVGPDGATHQAIEDIAIMRCIPKMTVVAPCDMIETRKAVVALSKAIGPAHIRFAREKTPVFTSEETPFILGKAEIFRDPSINSGRAADVAIIACGPLVHNALLAAEELSKKKIQCMVVNNHTIKPMDEKTIISVAKRCGAVVTVEEHQIMGGLGGAVAEVLAKNYPVPMEFVGVQDRFGESGNPNELIEYFGMGVSSIVEAVKKVLKRKK